MLMPIVASMGGIAGSQTLTLAIRGIARSAEFEERRALMLKELAVGTLNSLIWAVVVAVIAGVWFHSTQIADPDRRSDHHQPGVCRHRRSVLPLLLNASASIPRWPDRCC